MSEQNHAVSSLLSQVKGTISSTIWFWPRSWKIHFFALLLDWAKETLIELEDETTK